MDLAVTVDMYFDALKWVIWQLYFSLTDMITFTAGNIHVTAQETVISLAWWQIQSSVDL